MCAHVYLCMYMAYCFIPILFLLPFILSLFYVYLTFIYFAIPITIGKHAESPGQARPVGRSAAYTSHQASGRAAADRQQQSGKNAGASSCRPTDVASGPQRVPTNSNRAASRPPDRLALARVAGEDGLRCSDGRCSDGRCSDGSDG